MFVEVARKDLAYFRRKALSTPNEILAMLLGRRLGPNKVVIDMFVYPLIDSSSPTSIQPNQKAFEEVWNMAAKEGLRVLGSIHSHPNFPPVLSKTDLAGALHNRDLISAIVEVTDRRTSVVFWTHSSPLPCEWEYTKNV